MENNNKNDAENPPPSGVVTDMTTDTSDEKDVKPGNDGTKKSRLMMILAMAALGSIAGIVILLVCLIEKRRCTAEDITNAVYTLSSAEDLETVDRPAYKALEWMLNDDACPHDKNFKQRYAMAAISFGLGQPDRDDYEYSWQVDTHSLRDHSRHECDWSPYLDCSQYTSRGHKIYTDVYNLAMDPANSEGFIAPEIGLLSNLEYLRRAEYEKVPELSGAIPSEIGKLQSLQSLDLLSFLNTGLTGPIPTEIGLLQHLTSLRVHSLHSLPTEIGVLPALQYLKVRFFESTIIPTEIGSLPSLTDLIMLSWGSAAVRIPTEIGNLPLLNKLVLDDVLSGPLPTEIGRLAQLTRLEVVHNRNLTATIPTEIGECANLQDIQLEGNALEGPFPSEIGNLSDLRWLILGGNRLTGTIPTEIAKMSNVRIFDLGSNSFSGTIPDQMAQLENLRTFDLRQSGRNLSGTVPCDSFEHLESGAADCAVDEEGLTEVECTCCTVCQ